MDIPAPKDTSVEIKADTLFKALFDHHLYQDRIMWDQVRTLLALQGAVLAAGYVTRGTFYVLLPALIGIVFTVIVFLFVTKAGHDRDINLNTIQELIRFFSSADLQRILGTDGQTSLLRTGDDLNGRRLLLRKWNFPLVRGRVLYQSAFWLSIALDSLSVPFFYLMPRP